jgi:hypothetical protein
LADPTLHWTFAYGSNMHLEDLRGWLTGKGHAAIIHRAERAWLVGHRLVWNYRSVRRGCGAANIEAHAPSTLHGVALQVDAATLLGIEAKEGHPHVYSHGFALREVVLASGGTAMAFVFVVQPAHRTPGVTAPSRHYLSLLIEGAEHHGLPPDYVEMLRKIETAG